MSNSAIRRIVRRLTRWAWLDFLDASSRVEWKYGRTDDGLPKRWEEWDDLRECLGESNALRCLEELEDGGKTE